MSEISKLISRARRDLEDFKLIERKARKKLADSPETLAEVTRLAGEVKIALKDKDPGALGPAVEALEEFIDAKLESCKPNPVWETIKALLIAFAIALCIRAAFIEPFRIPSGSMIPTLLEGDQLMVNKLAFGPDYYMIHLDPPASLDDQAASFWRFKVGGHQVAVTAHKLWMRRRPQRGEVVVFRWPNKPNVDYIKRVIGLPGDEIELRNGDLYINDRLQPETAAGKYGGPKGGDFCRNIQLYEETLDRDGGTMVHPVLHCQDNHAFRASGNYGPIKVPEGKLFMMGDNRDNSSDSRSWGFVPLKYLKGEALFIHLPLDPERHYLPRWNRFFKKIQ